MRICMNWVLAYTKTHIAAFIWLDGIHSGGDRYAMSTILYFFTFFSACIVLCESCLCFAILIFRCCCIQFIFYSHQTHILTLVQRLRSIAFSLRIILNKTHIENALGNATHSVQTSCGILSLFFLFLFFSVSIIQRIILKMCVSCNIAILHQHRSCLPYLYSLVKCAEFN